MFFKYPRSLFFPIEIIKLCLIEVSSDCREGLLSYKHFIAELEDDILPAEAERRCASLLVEDESVFLVFLMSNI